MRAALEVRTTPVLLLNPFISLGDDPHSLQLWAPGKGASRGLSPPWVSFPREGGAPQSSSYLCALHSRLLLLASCPLVPKKGNPAFHGEQLSVNENRKGGGTRGINQQSPGQVEHPLPRSTRVPPGLKVLPDGRPHGLPGPSCSPALQPQRAKKCFPLSTCCFRAGFTARHPLEGIT